MQIAHETSEDLQPTPVTAVRKLLPLIERHAAQCEQEGRVLDEVIEALEQAGLFQMMFPKRAGGSGHKIITHIETVAEIAKACPGTAWAFSLLSGVTASVASMPPAISELVFKTGAERVCSVAAQTGTAQATEDGYAISGRWGYASGCLHADWALNGVKIIDEQDQVIDAGFALMPLQHPQVRIENTWHVAGVCGSGSNTVVAENIVVAPIQILRYSELRRSNAADPKVLAAMEPRDRWPVEPLFPLGVLAPMLGAASAMLEKVRKSLPERQIIGWRYDSQSESQVFVQQLGEAAMEIDSAWLHIRRAAEQIDNTAQIAPLNGFEKACIQADCGYAMGLLRKAGERLMDIAGPAAFAQNNSLQRLWRDLNVGSRHTALNTRLSLELYGRALTERESNLLLLPEIKRQ